MAFDLTETLTEIRIYDEKTNSTQSLFARDPDPREQLAYERGCVVTKGGKTQNHVRRTRLKFGALIVDHPQPAATPQDEGYGFRRGSEWVPLTVDVQDVPVAAEEVLAQYSRPYGSEWAKWIQDLPPWKLFLLARAPGHLERVANVVFDGAADYKQRLADGVSSEDEEGEDGAENP